jgi:hypothetical protein
MAKKHWIYIKRGLSEDAKHRAAMGQCIWLYMHIIDRADWETGIAYDWKDKEEASDMGMPVDTLRAQRTKLEQGDYIRCIQKQHGQDIKIMEWRNPRDYSSDVKNPRNEGMDLLTPSDVQGLNHGLNQVPRNIKTPTLDSKVKELDPLDGIIKYQLKPKGIRDAFAKHFKLTPNWEAKYNRQFLEWSVSIDMTPEQIERAADLWRMDKRFNWSVPTLKGIQEHWMELIATEQTEKPLNLVY